MDVGDFENYCEAISVMEAQEMRMAITAASFPNYKDTDRKQLSRELHRAAHPATWQRAEKMSSEEMANFLKGKILGG